jgi:bifunctional ADP-heptose synthase (sugar kinase/adenylyltransferase)
MVIQTNGGVEQNMKYSWARDIPHNIAQQVVDKLKYAYTIFHIRRDDQPVLRDTVQLTDGFRAVAIVIAMSSKRLFMDSFAQHVVDPVGAGDALIAYSTLAMLSTSDPIIASIIGNIAAGCECEYDGNIPISIGEVKSKLNSIQKIIESNT